MGTFKVNVDISAHVAAVRDLQSKQLPFITAKTLTNCAQDGQAEVRRNEDRAFKLRNNWTQQGVRIKPANKNGNSGRIEADVHTDTANRATGAPDYLGRQEDGGEKVPFGGRHYIAVPTKYLRQMCPGVIPQELRPKNLLGATGGRYTARTRKGQIALRNQVRARGFEFFLQDLKDGHKAILGRYFTDRDAYPFYLLITEAHIKRSQLEMEATVASVVNARFERHWDENWRQAFASGLKL